jgi:hypothetical protein
MKTSVSKECFAELQHRAFVPSFPKRQSNPTVDHDARKSSARGSP